MVDDEERDKKAKQLANDARWMMFICIFLLGGAIGFFLFGKEFKAAFLLGLAFLAQRQSNYLVDLSYRMRWL